MSQQNNDDKIKSDSDSNDVNTHLDFKNNTVNSSQPQKSVSNIREHMVEKATEFLVALPVRNDFSMEKKFKFLRSKGLTDQEIQASFQRVSAIRNNNPNSHTNAPPQVYNNFSSAFGAIQTPIESQGWFIRLFRTIAYAATVAYIGYQIYKNYIENWLFGNKTSVLEKRFDVLEQNMQRCITLLEGRNISNPNDYIVQQHQIDQIRAELKSIKSLLLNRSQFPSAPASSGLPHWQLAKNMKPQVEQQKVASNSVQQKTASGVDTLISVQPINTEIRTNGMETPIRSQPVNTDSRPKSIESLFPTQPVEEKDAETTSSQQRTLFYNKQILERTNPLSDEHVSEIL